MTNSTVTRLDISYHLSSTLGFTIRLSSLIVDQIIDHIVNAIAQDNEVKLASFGMFTVSNKKERMGRNPKTGELAVIKARKSLSFKSSPNFKKMLAKEAVVI